MILVADPKGDPDYVRFIHQIGSNRVGVDWQFVVHDAPGGWGQPQRNRAYDLAPEGNHVWCLADDDVATATALERLRLAAEWCASWTVFRAGRGSDVPWLWNEPEIRVGNIDADCILAPAGVKSRWGLDYEGDVAFARALEQELGEPCWDISLVAVTRPSGDYLVEHYMALAAS